MERLTWQIEGEFITDLARTWFWNENRPYKDSEELIKSCISSATSKEEYKNIALDIIEGRKKFVGVNQFELVNDGKNVRYISDKINDLHKQLEIEEIKDKIEYSGIDYVDPYSTVKSLKEARNHNVKARTDCEIWFMYSCEDQRRASMYGDCDTLPSAKKPTKAGLWLFDKPELIYRATNGNQHVSDDEFWKNIYELIKDDKVFAERNNYYLATLRMKAAKKEYWDRFWESCKEKADQEAENPYKFMSEEWFEFEFRKNNDYQYLLKPDAIDKWEGLIDPQGNYYSCEFGGHNIKAWYLLVHKDKNLEQCDLHEFKVDMNNALDYLLNQGWCATRFLPVRGEFISYPPLSSGKQITKAQIDRIFDAMIKFDVRPDNIDEIMSM